MPFVKLPDGSLFPAAPGETAAQALEAARKKYPDAFDTRVAQEGFIPAMKASAMRIGSGAGLTASGLGALDEATARAGDARTEEQIQKHIYKPTTYDDVKKAFVGQGMFGTDEAPGGGVQLLKFWRDQLGAMAPQVAATAAGSYAGAKLGALTANPIGAGLGAILGGVGVNIPIFQGSNLQAQVQEQKERGAVEPLQHGSALAAAIPQAGMEAAGQAILLGKLGFSKAASDLLLTKTAGERAAAMAKKAQENLAKSMAKGAGRGLAAEIPIELSQQVLERAQAGMALEGPEAMKDYEATLVGTIGPAALLGTAGGAHARHAARQEDNENKSKAEVAARKAKFEEEERVKRDPATISGHQAELSKLNDRAGELQMLLQDTGLAKGIRAAVNKELQGIVGQMKPIHDALVEAGAAPVANVPSLKAKAPGEATTDDVNAAIQKVKDKQADMVVDEYGNLVPGTSKAKVLGADEGPGYDKQGKQLTEDAADFNKLESEMRYERAMWERKQAQKEADAQKLLDKEEERRQKEKNRWVQSQEELEQHSEKLAGKEEQRRQAEQGANIAAERVTTMLQYAPLEFRGTKEPFTPEHRKEILGKIDSGLVDRDVQRALGIKGLGEKAHDLSDPEQAKAVLPALQERLDYLQGRKDALFDPKIELTNPDGTLTREGAKAVAREMQLKEVQTLAQLAQDALKPDVAGNLVDTYVARAAAEQERPADLIFQSGVPQHHEEGVHRQIAHQQKAYDDLRITLDDVIEERFLGVPGTDHKDGRNAAAAETTREGLLKNAEAAKKRYINAALRQAAHYRALNKREPLTQTEARKAAEEMNQLLDELIVRSTSKKDVPELVPAQMRSGKVTTPAHVVMKYAPGEEPFPDRDAVVGQVGFEGAEQQQADASQQLAFGRAVPKDVGGVWKSGAPRSPGEKLPVRNLKEEMGSLQQALAKVTSGLKREFKGEPRLVRTALRPDDGPVERQKERDKIVKDLPRFRAYVTGKIENLLERPNVPPEARTTLTAALDMLDANRGPRPLVEDIETFVDKQLIGTHDRDLLLEIRAGMQGDVQAKGSEVTDPKEKVVAEKQPDLFDQPPPIARSIAETAKELDDATAALDAFRTENKGRKLDLAKFRDLLKAREIAEYRHLLMVKEAEKEGGTGFIDKGTDVPSGAVIKESSKKFMAFLNSAAVRKLKDYFTPGWRALNKAKQAQKEAKSRQAQLDEIDNQIDRVESDLKKFKDDNFKRLMPELSEEPTVAEVEQYMRTYRELAESHYERNRAHDAAMAPLRARREALLREPGSVQKRGETPRTTEQSRVDEAKAATTHAIEDAYEGNVRTEFAERLENDKDIQQLRMQITGVREAIAELKATTSPTHQWAAEANKQLKDQINELERLGRKYEDEYETLRASIFESIDKNAARAEAKATKAVAAQRMVLDRQEKALNKASAAIEKRRKVPLDVVRTPETSTRALSAQLAAVDKNIRLTNAQLEKKPDDGGLNRRLTALQKEKAALLSAEIAATAPYVATQSWTYLTDRVNTEKNEIQKQRAALAEAERIAQEKKDALAAERAAFEERRAELNRGRAKKTHTTEEVVGEEQNEESRASNVRYELKRTQGMLIRDRMKALREQLKAGRETLPDEEKKALKDEIKALAPQLAAAKEKDAAIREASAQRTAAITALRARLATLPEGSKAWHATERQLIAKREAHRQLAAKENEVLARSRIEEQDGEPGSKLKARKDRRGDTYVAPDETPEERAERLRVENEAKAEAVRREERFAFETAPKSETVKAQAAAAKAAKFAERRARRTNYKPPLRTGVPQRQHEKEVEADIERAKKGKFDPDNEDRFSQGEPAMKTGNTAAGIRSRLQKEFGSVEGFDRVTTVVQTEAELPSGIRNHPEFEPGRTRGVAHKGRVYMVADHIPHGEELAVFLHEAGAHLGFDKLMNKNDRLWLAKRVEEWAKGNDNIAKIAKEALRRGGTNPDEVIAYMTEGLVKAGVQPTAKTGEGSWLSRVIQAFTNALNRFLGKPTNFTPQELVDFAYGAANMVVEGKFVSDEGPMTRFSTKYGPGHDPQLKALAEKVIARDRTLSQKLMDAVAGFHQWAVDAQGPYHMAMTRAVKAGLATLKSTVQTSYFMRQSQRGHYWVAHALSMGNVELFKNTDGDWEIRGTDGNSAQAIIDALKPLVKNGTNSAAVFEQYTLWRAAKRAELVGKDALNFGEDVTEQQLADARRKGDAIPEYQKASDAHDAFNKGLIDFNVAAGSLTKEQGDTLNAQKYYIPFYRKDGAHAADVMLMDAGAPIKIGNIKNSPYLHGLVGGDTAILSFEDSIQQNASLLMGMALQNLAARNAAFELQNLGLAYVKKGSLTGNDVVHFKIDGEVFSAKVGDGAKNVQVEKLEKQLGRIPPNSRAFEIVRAKLDRVRAGTGQFDDISGELLVKSMEGMSSAIPSALRLLTMPANLLRKGVTRNPIYSARQLIRDPWAAYFSTGADINPFITAVKGVHKIFTDGGKDYREAQHRGMIGGQVFNGTEEDVKKIMRAHMEGGGVGSLFSALDRMAMRADGVTRVELMKKFEAQGLSRLETTMAVNASMDFTRRGSSSSVHAMSMMIPFFNAQIQGLDVVYKSLTNQMTSGEKTAAYAKLVKRGALLAGMTMLYAATMQDDEAYKNANPLTRLNNFFVRVPGLDEPIKIPIPFEFGLMAKAIPETLFLAAFSDKKLEPLVKGLGQAIHNVIPGGTLVPMPQAIKPIYEAYFNKSAFSGLPIISDRLDKLQPQERYTERTTEGAKLLGGTLGTMPVVGAAFSPALIDHFVSGYLGGLGTNASALMSMLMPDFMRRSDNAGPVTKKMSEVPFIGQTLQTNTGMGVVSHAYEVAKRMEMAKDTFDRLVQLGDKDEVAAFHANNKKDIALAEAARKFRQHMGELNKQEDMVRLAPKSAKRPLTPDEKLEVIERIKRAKIQYSDRFVRGAG